MSEYTFQRPAEYVPSEYYDYASPQSYVRIASPAYSKGILVLETDDGTIGNYSHWLPLLERKGRQYNQWAGRGEIPLSPCINTGRIGTGGFMSVAQLQEVADVYGWEPHSHGRHHVSIGKHTLTRDALAGSTTLYVDGASMLTGGDYEFAIINGESQEVFKVVRGTGPTYGEGTIEIDRPLAHAFPAGSDIQITPESAYTLLQGAVDDLESWGLPCRHHVYTYHSATSYYYSDTAIGWVGDLFVSGRGRIGILDPSDPHLNLANLPCQIITASKATFDAQLDAVAAGDLIYIVYGHGETAANILANVEYVIDAAMARGIRCMTISDALKAKGLMD